MHAAGQTFRIAFGIDRPGVYKYLHFFLFRAHDDTAFRNGYSCRFGNISFFPEESCANRSGFLSANCRLQEEKQLPAYYTWILQFFKGAPKGQPPETGYGIGRRPNRRIAAEYILDFKGTTPECNSAESLFSSHRTENL